MSKLKKKTVYVYQYAGYNGSYARSKTLMWVCVVIGTNGKKMHGGDWMSEGNGYVDKQYADRDAAKWSEFTGWPLVQLGRCEQFDSKNKY